MIKLTPILSSTSLLIHLLNQSHPLDTFHEQTSTDGEKFKNDVIIIFTRTEFNNSSGTENSSNHNFVAPRGSFSSLKNFAHKPVIYYSSLKCDADYEFSANNDMLQVN